MSQRNLLLAVLLNVLFIDFAQGQQQNDSSLIRKYKADTLGFSTFPIKNVVDGIRPDKAFNAWELDSWTRWEGHRCVQRLRTATQELLSKPESGFGTFCPPSGCFWYFSVKHDRETETIADAKALKKFIGAIDTPYDAYVWLVANWEGASTFIPAFTSGITYKKVEEGYLISLRRRIGDCPVTSASLIYFIGEKFEIIRVGMYDITSSNACI